MISRIFLGGLPTTALLPLMTIGRSINLGFSIITSINSLSVKVEFLKMSFQSDSFLRTSSIGFMRRSLIISASSFAFNYSSRYFITLKSVVSFSRIFKASLDLLHLGLW